MRSNKRKRLEAKGWKVGSAKEFLGLSSQEEAYIEIKLRLAESLRNQRLRRQMTQSDLAKAIKSSQSRVAKMEAGEGSVSLDLLVRTLLALGASSKRPDPTPLTTKIRPGSMIRDRIHNEEEPYTIPCGSPRMSCHDRRDPGLGMRTVRRTLF